MADENEEVLESLPQAAESEAVSKCEELLDQIDISFAEYNAAAMNGVKTITDSVDVQTRAGVDTIKDVASDAKSEIQAVSAQATSSLDHEIAGLTKVATSLNDDALSGMHEAIGALDSLASTVQDKITLISGALDSLVKAEDTISDKLTEKAANLFAQSVEDQTDNMANIFTQQLTGLANQSMEKYFESLNLSGEIKGINQAFSKMRETMADLDGAIGTVETAGNTLNAFAGNLNSFSDQLKSTQRSIDDNADSLAGFFVIAVLILILAFVLNKRG